MSGSVTGQALKKAIEGRDGATLAGFYANDAVIRIIDRYNPPSRPKEIVGGTAIAEYWNDVCGREMTHRVETAIIDGPTLAFSESCAYPDGMKVYCSASAELRNGRIARQTVIQAWDE